MPPKSPDLLQGTLEMLVLKTLALAPLHGWGLAQRINQMSRGALLVQQGSLYPALQRMKRRGWVRSSWGTTDNNRRARYYAITPAGRRQLEREQASWERASSAVNAVMNTRLVGGEA